VTVIFATCHDQPLIAPDDRPLAAALREQGVTATPMPWTYTRVDVVVSSRGPLLMELELIEPELYFLHVPTAASRFARAIQRRLESLT
jgi:hypothetical protein